MKGIILLNQKSKDLGIHLASATKDFKHVASLLPSSTYTIRSIVKSLPKNAQNVVEYGAGSGTITKGILKHLPNDGRLISIEINSGFISHLKKISDPRFALLSGDVGKISPNLKSFFPSGVDAIVSGIPFSLLEKSQRCEIVKHTRHALRNVDGLSFIKIRC